MRSWWRRLRDDPALPAWLRVACLLAAPLTLYSWAVQLIFFPIVGGLDYACDVTSSFGSRTSLFLDLSKPAIIVNPAALEYAIFGAVILGPWAATGFFVTARSRSDRRFVYLRSIVACTLSLLAFPGVLILAATLGVLLAISTRTVTDTIIWDCDAAGPGYLEDVGALLPVLYPALLVYLLYRSYRLARARRALKNISEA